jgi:hypothetical protein
MALRALRPSPPVFTGINPEPARIVAHRVRCPHACAMARSAIVTECLCDMIRICHARVIRLMALVAIRVVQLIIPIDVARLTLY